MGKSTLIIVLGMGAIIAFFILKLNANSKENTRTTVDMFEQTQARLIANSAVEIYLEKLYEDTLMINTTSSKHNLFNGTYTVKLEGTLPNVRVTSTSRFQGVTHVSVADAFLQPIKFPQLPGAMYISNQALNTTKLTGDMAVTGVNHDINGIRDEITTPAVHGIGVDTEEDKTQVLANLLKPGEIEGKINENGDIGAPSVGVTPLGYDWAKLYQFLANNADQTFIDNIPKGTDLGTLISPKITLINASASNSKNISISQNTGSGIMIINGDVSFQGNFTYKGIIICYKSTKLRFSTQGTNEILGGLIAAGKNIDLSLSGTFIVKYSKDVLDLVKFNLRSDGFEIISWYE
jgi:hypothetical protein